MTKEINSLTTKELKEFKNFTSILNKVYSLSPEDIDKLSTISKENEDLKERVNNLEKAIKELSSRFTDAIRNSNNASIKMAQYMNKSVEGFHLNEQ